MVHQSYTLSFSGKIKLPFVLSVLFISFVNLWKTVGLFYSLEGGKKYWRTEVIHESLNKELFTWLMTVQQKVPRRTKEIIIELARERKEKFDLREKQFDPQDVCMNMIQIFMCNTTWRFGFVFQVSYHSSHLILSK